MLVKVFNDNTHPYKEQFRGRDIEIPAKGFIEMEYDEATIFHGAFTSIKMDGDGHPLKEGYKMIRIEEPPLAAHSAKVDPLMCIACRYLGKDPSDLQSHVLSAHAGQHVVDEEAENEIKRKKTK